MKLPLQRAELLKTWGVIRFTAYCVAALIFMLIFGYQIARFHQQQDALVAKSEAATRALLAQENDQLKMRVSTLEVESVLASKSVSALKKALETQQQRSRALEEQLSFYQRVVAPEVTQDGFFIDGVQVSPTASDNMYRLKAVLLQQNNNKSMLRGDLTIKVRGSMDGKPYEISAGEGDFLPEGNLKWGFKYFQTVDLEFVLPQGFIPEQLIFSTDVYQWKTKRGEYFNSMNWVDIYDAPASEGSQDV